MKINLAVIFGSRSCEHDVSVISGLQAAGAADQEKYRTMLVYIDRQGPWYTGDRLKEAGFYQNFDPAQVTHVLPRAEKGKLQLIEYPTEKRSLFGGAKKLVAEADVVMPVMHGMNGEDGTLQGMLELWGVPYTSSGVLGSSVGMDKIAMKQLFRGCGFPVLPDCWIDRAHWKRDQAGCVEKIEAALEYPMFVKPANLGSSIGISRANDREGLIHALDVASAYDRRILIEKAVEKLSEVNCAVLGYADDVQASVLEMPTRWEEFLTFDEKYLRGSKGSSKGMTSLSRKIPAPISGELTEKIRDLSVQVFKSLDCKGVVRIDYIIDESDQSYYIGEINTIPGSLAFYLFEATGSGLSFSAMVDKMVECALLANADRNQSVFSYDSTILQKFTSGQKGGLKNRVK